MREFIKKEIVKGIMEDPMINKNLSTETIESMVEDLFGVSEMCASSQSTIDMNFGDALSLCKDGAKIAREGWNGKGMYVFYQKGYPEGINCNENMAAAMKIKEGTLVKIRPYLQMKCADDTFQMWLASQSDILAEDWMIVG